VLQDDLAALRRPTGRVVVHTPDAEAAVALLDGQLGERAGDRLVVRAGDAAQLNATLVGAGVRVRELATERRTLEQIVLAATSAGSDRVDRPAGPPGPDPGSRTDRGLPAGLVAEPDPEGVGTP
jgi:ABC-2 type transport system ATP-binding protein